MVLENKGDLKNNFKFDFWFKKTMRFWKNNFRSDFWFKKTMEFGKK